MATKTPRKIKEGGKNHQSGVSANLRVRNFESRRETRQQTAGPVQSASRVTGKNGIGYYRSKSKGEKQVTGRVKATKTATQIRAQQARIANARAAGYGSDRMAQSANNAASAALGFKALGVH